MFVGITVILGLIDWTGLARAVRSKLLALREEDYVKAAELMGAKPKRIIARHLLPNFMSHLIASATLSIPSMILGETALSFLGLGVQPPEPSWGLMIAEAKGMMFFDSWLIVIPGTALFALVLAINLLGDGLRDVTAPENRN